MSHLSDCPGLNASSPIPLTSPCRPSGSSLVGQSISPDSLISPNALSIGFELRFASAALLVES